MISSRHRVMRFPCLPLLGCVALLGLLVRCDDTYRAEVYVVGSNPQDYGVSVVTTTYPATVMNNNQAADESKPLSAHTSAPVSSSSSSSPENNTPGLQDVSNRPTSNHGGATTISTTETPLRTSTDHREELSSSLTCFGTSPCKAEVSPPSRSTPVVVPVVPGSRARAAQQMPGDTCCQTRQINNIQCNRNARTPTEGTVDANNKTYTNLNAPTACCSMQPKQNASGQKKTQNQSDHPKPVNYTNEMRARYSPVAESGATEVMVNSIVTVDDATPNDVSKIYGKTNPCLNNNRKSSQQAQNSQQSRIQPVLTDQTRERVQQIPTIQEESSERRPFSQSATIHQPSINQSGGPTQAVISQMVVLPPNPANKTEDIQEPQINLTNVNQPTLATSPNTTEIIQTPNNRTEFNRIQNSTKPEAKHEASNNQSEIKQTQTETSTGVTQETNTNKTRLEQVTNQTFPTGYNQTQIQTTETVTDREISPNQTESILSEISKLRTNSTRLARSLNNTQRETELERASRRRRAIAREKSVSMAANQTELNETEIMNKELNGTSLTRALNHTKSKTQMERRPGRDGSAKDPSRRMRGSKLACTCVEEVIQRTARCREPCTRNEELTHTLFVNAAVILVIYVLLLAFVYREFRRRKRAEEEWRRDALNWMCRERGMRWLARMFS